MVSIAAGRALQQFHGVYCYLGSDLDAVDATSGFEVTFNSERFDTDAFHDTATNNERLVIPSAFDGMYVAVWGWADLSLITADLWTQLTIRHKNSSGTLIKASPSRVEDGQTVAFHNASMGPVLVSTGDIFTLTVSTVTDTSITITAGGAVDRTAFGLQVVGQ